MNGSIQRGFSFPELLATVGIGALLLSVGIPGLTSFTKNARQISVSNELLADIHYARDLAITNNDRVTICPSSNGATCNGAGWADGRIVFIDLDGDRVVDVEETVKRVTADMRDIDVATAEFGAAITYLPNGRAMAETVRDNTGEFIICDDRGADHARALIVDISGRARISQENARGAPPTCPSI
jgi:type IV fimbrial biogenesis protein FimT